MNIRLQCVAHRKEKHFHELIMYFIVVIILLIWMKIHSLEQF